MALFKISKGNRENLNFTNCPWTEGYAYFCEDTQEFFIDHLLNNQQVRSKLVTKANEMVYKANNNLISISAEDIISLLNSSILYTKNQSLSSSQKEQARKNIDATIVTLKSWTMADTNLA